MWIKTMLAAAFFAALLVTPAAAGENTGTKGGTEQIASPTTWTFDAEAPGGLPIGSVVFSGAWAVRAEPDAPSPANAICQTAESPFPALMLGRTEYQDIRVSARFKPISGRSDQAAGILFRIRDRNNYYIVRANALENNVNLYKFVNGWRSLIKESYAKVSAGKWQELRVEAAGDRIQAFLDGKQTLDIRDSTFGSGKVGLWTKADSLTCFDDVEIQMR